MKTTDFERNGEAFTKWATRSIWLAAVVVIATSHDPLGAAMAFGFIYTFPIVITWIWLAWKAWRKAQTKLSRHDAWQKRDAELVAAFWDAYSRCDRERMAQVNYQLSKNHQGYQAQEKD